MSKQRRSPEEYKRLITEKYGNEYTLLSEYTRSCDKIHIRHNICGNEFWSNAGDLMKQPICPICGKQKYSDRLAKKPEEFQKMFDSITNNEYMLLSQYHRSNEKVKIKHLTCGNEFMMMPEKFIAGQRCPECRPNKKLTQNDFNQRVFDMYGDEFTVVGIFVNTYTKIDIKHNVCGNINFVRPSDFLLRKTFCPHCNHSSLEAAIAKVLKDLQISYGIGKKFDDLIGLHGNQLSYDFYFVYENKEYLVEAQGEQHYNPIKFFGDQKKFEEQKEHDKRKRDYALQHNFELIEIPYWDFKNIEEILTSRLAISKSA